MKGINSNGDFCQPGRDHPDHACFGGMGMNHIELFFSHQPVKLNDASDVLQWRHASFYVQVDRPAAIFIAEAGQVVIVGSGNRHLVSRYR